LIEQRNQLVEFWKGKFYFTESELKAFMEVDRSNFVEDKYKERAYDDTPLPCLRGKTISQPTTVMIMTSSLELKRGDKVFEVGTGSGYQTAIIANIVGEDTNVISTEVVPELVTFAKQNLKRAGIKNVEVYEEDGSRGLAGKGPFDSIIITAACREFPKKLLEQLKDGGIIVGPVGDKHEQEMVKGIKQKDGRLTLEFLGQFLFSPLYGKFGFVD